MPTIGTTELAKRLGISRQRINELGRLGKITREADGQRDLDAVTRQLGRNLDPRHCLVPKCLSVEVYRTADSKSLVNAISPPVSRPQ